MTASSSSSGGGATSQIPLPIPLSLGHSLWSTLGLSCCFASVFFVCLFFSLVKYKEMLICAYILHMSVKSEDGTELCSFRFKDEDESQEVRAVERRIFLETLANQLPPDAISFSSKLAKIQRSESGETLLELMNRTKLSAKIVIGCDGICSPIAKWMGFSEPKYAGHCAFRGLAFHPDGQPYEPKVNYIHGKGVRGGCVPVSPTKVYRKWVFGLYLKAFCC